MNLEIFPKEGLGHIRFGMSSQDVARILGKAERCIDDPDNIMRCYYPNRMNVFFKSNRLYLVGASLDAVGITYKGIDIFKADPLEVLRLFERDCRPAFLCYDLIIFPSHSIGMGGFHEDYPEGKAITLEVPGAYDRHAANSEDITFLS